MKSGLTKVSDHYLPIDRPDRELKLPDLMTCLRACDNTTYVTWARGSIAAAAHEVECNSNQESQSGGKIIIKLKTYHIYKTIL
jgi:hypothetical protein